MPDRSSTHGDYSLYCQIARALKDLLQHGPDKHGDNILETYDQICGKIARILAGNESYTDHWEDIRGYAACMEKQVICPFIAKLPYDHVYVSKATDVISGYVSRGRAAYLTAIFEELSVLNNKQYKYANIGPLVNIQTIIDEYFAEYHRSQK